MLNAFLYLIKSEKLSFATAPYACLICRVQVTLVGPFILVFHSIFAVHKDVLRCRPVIGSCLPNVLLANHQPSSAIDAHRNCPAFRGLY